MGLNWSHHTRWLIQQLADTRDAYTRAHQIPEARPYDITGHVRHVMEEIRVQIGQRRLDENDDRPDRSPPSEWEGTPEEFQDAFDSTTRLYIHW